MLSGEVAVKLMAVNLKYKFKWIQTCSFAYVILNIVADDNKFTESLTIE